MRIYEQGSTTNYWYLGVRDSDGDRFHGYNGIFRGAFDSATGVYSSSSDRRLKKNLEELGVVMPNLLQLQPKYYHMKTQDDSEMKTIGFVAQEVQDLFPQFISGSEGDEFLGLDYSGMVTIAIKAIQEQQEQIENQKAEIESLKAQLSKQSTVEAKSEANTTEIESLKAELAAIKAMLLNSSTTEKEDK